MSFQAQKQVTDLSLQINSSIDRLNRLQRIFGFSLHIYQERGVPPESIDRMLTLLDLVDRELALEEREVKGCRELIKQIFRSLGHDHTPQEEIWS